MCQAIFSTVKLENQGVKYSPFSFSTNDQVKNSNITPMTSFIRTSAARDIHLLRRSKCKIQSVFDYPLCEDHIWVYKFSLESLEFLCGTKIYI